ncbi:MAG: restriction endonuclease [Enhygromyxa sp.]
MARARVARAARASAEAKDEQGPTRVTGGRATSFGPSLLRLGQSDPSFFERCVLDVLHALGYGTSRENLQQVGGSGDGGIDGIISLDRLGLEKVYVQAKRWKGNVGRPEIQGFFGALAGRRANKGVFITTSGLNANPFMYLSWIRTTLSTIEMAAPLRSTAASIPRVVQNR